MHFWYTYSSLVLYHFFLSIIYNRHLDDQILPKCFVFFEIFPGCVHNVASVTGYLLKNPDSPT